MVDVLERNTGSLLAQDAALLLIPVLRTDGFDLFF